MQRLSEAKACFLSESTEDMPKPDDLVKILDQAQVAQARNMSTIKMTFTLLIDPNFRALKVRAVMIS